MMDLKQRGADRDSVFESRLAVYLTSAGAMGTAMASEAQAVVIANNTVQPFGINGAVPIDFNSDGQIDYEIDHDRIDMSGFGGNVVDFLQIDKNDTNGASPGENPCPIDVFDTFPLNGNPANNTFDAGYVTPSAAEGEYPAALSAGTLIGPALSFEWQETDNFQGTGKTIRPNRLIDEDAGQCDLVICGHTAAQVAVPSNAPGFLGLGGQVRFLGVRMNLQDAGVTYGWIGIRITNQGNATGEVVGWGYETNGGPIPAALPEPGTSSCVLGALIVAALWTRWFDRRRSAARNAR